MKNIKLNYELSNKVKTFIDNAILEEISIGCSDSEVIKITKEDEVYYLKVAKLGLLTKEYNKITWLDGKLEVPKVVLYDTIDNIEYLITKSCTGQMICDDYYCDNPEIGLKVLKEAFNKIYKVDVANCPFNTDINYKLSLVEYNVNNNLVNESNFNESTLERFKTTKKLLNYLKENKFEDEKIFSHGDTSLPNIFGMKDKFTGFIDVGECGTADKWFDLAICEKSIRRNYGEEYVDKFYNELGITRDDFKIDYYLLMMELYL